MKPFLLLLIFLIYAGPLLSVDFNDTGNDSTGSIAEIDTALISRTIPKLLDAASIPGMAVSIIQKDTILYTRGFGIQNRKNHAPVTMESIFEAASLSKPVFAYLTMKLMEEGILDLDTPLLSMVPQDYLKKHYFKHSPIDGRFLFITARMILSHTSGLINWRLSDETLFFEQEMGKFNYSGEGYSFLQTVIEYLTNEKLHILAKERVFDPLGMNHTSMVWDKRMKPHFAVGYDMMGRQNRKPYMKKAVAAYSIYTTLGDYTRFMLSLMRGEGLSVESLNTILAPAVKIETRLYWGLGIGIHESGGNTFYWHWGDNTCFRNLVIMNKADQSGVCFFTNSYFGLSISDSLAAMVFGITPRLFRLDFMSLYEQIDSNDFLFTQTLLKKGLSAARQIEAHPEEELLREYGYLLICEGKTCEAIELFTYMVDLHPLSYIAYQGLGDAYLSDGRSDIAIQYYLHSLELNPHNALLLQKVRTLKSTDVGAYHDRILQPAYNMSSPG